MHPSGTDPLRDGLICERRPAAGLPDGVWLADLSATELRRFFHRTRARGRLAQKQLTSTGSTLLGKPLEHTLPPPGGQTQAHAASFVE
jgi:hypothetical protein